MKSSTPAIVATTAIGWIRRRDGAAALISFTGLRVYDHQLRTTNHDRIVVVLEG